jgi:uncharacterized membrane protein
MAFSTRHRNTLKKQDVLIIGGFILVFGIIFLSTIIFDWGGIKINNYEANIYINESGDMQIVENWEMYYGDSKRVRFRDIDYGKFPDDYNFPYSQTNTAIFDTSSASVRVWRDNTEVTSNMRIAYSWTGALDELGYPVACEPVRSNCESIFVDTQTDGGLYGNFTFQYEYTILGAVTQYSDISELNWVLFEYMEGRITEGTVNIFLPPNTFTTEDLYIWGHGISDGSIEIVSNTHIRMHIENVRPSEFLEFRLLMPNELFEANIHPRNVFINDGINKAIIMDYQANLATYSNLGITLTQVFLGASILVTLLTIVTMYRNKKKYFMPHETQFQGDYLRELPTDETPAEMSYYYHFGKSSDEDVTATLLDLIRRKYISMAYEGQELTSKDADFLLVLDDSKNIDDLLAHEKQIINWFFNIIGDTKRVRTKDIERFAGLNLANAQRFENEGRIFKNAVRTVIKKMTLNDPSLALAKRKAMMWIIIPIILLAFIFLSGVIYESLSSIPLNNTYSFILLIANIVLYVLFVNVQKRRSKEAQEHFVKWDAFKRFLTEFGNFQDYPMPGIIVWEHYLVFAVSLKVADKVMEQLTVKLPMNEEMARQSTFMGVGYGRRGFYYGAGFRTFNQSVRSARANAARKITQSRQSSGGRGGGFGGGSSRGGGGGGGRSR